MAGRATLMTLPSRNETNDARIAIHRMRRWSRTLTDAICPVWRKPPIDRLPSPDSHRAFHFCQQVRSVEDAEVAGDRQLDVGGAVQDAAIRDDRIPRTVNRGDV